MSPYVYAAISAFTLFGAMLPGGWDWLNCALYAFALFYALMSIFTAIEKRSENPQ